ncbi:MAG: 3-phosphoshikimate 1-carboxyvinyltransferase [Bacteroidetes bacterium]|nr:3-phosphoshikimate 1-carboxyvinyltransferase [Bacteroidota bacterium]
MNLKLHKPSGIHHHSIQLPGSKSISNRVLIIKALSGLPFSIQNISDSDDTSHLEKALTNYSKTSLLDVGHAGTDMRFLTAFLSLKNGDYELTGSERLQQRPIRDLVDVLRTLGADIAYKKNEGFPPLQIKGKSLQGGTVEISGKVSSQFISALLLAAPYFTNGLEITITSELVSRPYVNMTIEIMREFGAAVDWKGSKIVVSPKPYAYSKPDYIIESDWSAVSYYYSMVALSKIGTELTVKSLFKNSLQADAACENIYKNFGVTTTFSDNEICISKNSDATKALLELDFIECPDIAQTVVCTCIGLQIPFCFLGLQTLKVKETDRILALKNEIKKFGIDITVSDSTIEWPVTSLMIDNSKVSIATYHDHRMAMSFAPLCLLVDGIIIEDAKVVSKSYPLFWEHLKQIGITYCNV